MYSELYIKRQSAHVPGVPGPGYTRTCGLLGEKRSSPHRMGGNGSGNVSLLLKPRQHEKYERMETYGEDMYFNIYSTVLFIFTNYLYNIIIYIYI